MTDSPHVIEIGEIPPDPVPPRVTAPHVFQAITAITAELSKIGIAKTRTNEAQHYKFRGIDDVYNVLAPLLAKHRLNILPRVLKGEREKDTVGDKGKTQFFATLTVNYAFVSSLDGSMFEIISAGEGMDSGDKATNKAFSAAYKYAVMQAFAIPVEGTPDADAENPGEEQEQPASEIEVAALEKLITDSKVSRKKILKYFEIADLKTITPSQAKSLRGWIQARENDGAASA